MKALIEPVAVADGQVLSFTAPDIRMKETALI
jgi:hypothetical protein